MLQVFTKIDPDDFLDKIIDNLESHKIAHWKTNEDEVFTHTSTKWGNQAWIQVANVDTFHSSLEFFLTIDQNVDYPNEITGMYWGSFIKMLITHFSEDFDSLKLQNQAVQDL